MPPLIARNKLCNNTISACSEIDLLENYYQKRSYYEFQPYVNKMVVDMATFNYDEELQFTQYPKSVKLKDENTMSLEYELKNKNSD